MALVNFSVCLFVFLHHLSTAYMYEAVSESGVSHTDPKPEDAEVRCYCNTAQCVGTGYMCLSTPGGGCYSEVPAPRRAHHARHGCLHHLADTPQEALSYCQNSPGGSPALTHSLLLCCFQDLCNHEDSPQARARLNVTSSEFDANAVASERGANFNGEVWFKAATIAVPVCGALILFILVAVAVRLLKADALLHADRKLRLAIHSTTYSNFNGEVWFKAATIAVPVCGALILFILVAVAVRLLKANALLHADRKLRLAIHSTTYSNFNGEVPLNLRTREQLLSMLSSIIAVPVCGALFLFILVAVAVRLLKADGLLHADRKLRLAIHSTIYSNFNGEVQASTIAVPVCGALILFILVAVAVRLLKADALLHADRKLRLAIHSTTYSITSRFKASTIAVTVCGALMLFILVAVAVRLLKADALLHADRKLRGGYMSPLAQNTSEDVKKVWVGSPAAPLLVSPGSCLVAPDGRLVAVERAQLADASAQQLCDIQR